MVLLQCDYVLCSETCYVEVIPLILIQLFFAVLFLQSGLDKLLNYKSEFEWTKNHFAKSLLKNTIGLLFPLLTLMEILAGILSVTAIVISFTCYDDWFVYSNTISAITLLSLFAGQRIAKDYAGAANLTGYFLISVLGIYLSL